MDRRCPYCDQLLLSDDTVCWQCGRALAGANETATARDLWQEAGRQLQLSPRLFYGGLTLLLVVAALLLTAFLGRQPRLPAARTDLPAGWAWFRNSHNDFILFLPRTWELLDPGTAERQAAVDWLMESEAALRRSYEPLGLLDDELQTIFYATGPLPSQPHAEGLLLVGSSRALNQLSPAELLSVAASGAAQLGLALETAQEVEEGGESHVLLDLLLESDAGARRCRQQLYPGVRELLLVVACAPPESGPQQTLAEILGSFQRLSP